MVASHFALLARVQKSSMCNEEEHLQPENVLQMPVFAQSAENTLHDVAKQFG